MILISVDEIKQAVCEYLLKVNRDFGGPFIPPCAINWLGDDIASEVLEVLLAEATWTE